MATISMGWAPDFIVTFGDNIQYFALKATIVVLFTVFEFELSNSGHFSGWIS